MAESEGELLARARRGDGDAFADLCTPYLRRTYNLALRLCGHPETAADVCQDALVRAFTSLDRFRGDAAFGTWLLRIVHNLCVDEQRRRLRQPRVPLPDEQALALADPLPGPEVEALRHERHLALARALRRLDPAFRAAVVLRDVQGLSYEEAAAVAGVPVGTLKSRVHRGRAALRELLRGTVVSSG